MKVYVDSNSRCHTTNPNGNFREVETDFFNGKCQSFIEGHCYDDRKDWVSIYAWKSYAELEAAQAQYDTMLDDMDKAYAEGVASA